MDPFYKWQPVSFELRQSVTKRSASPRPRRGRRSPAHQATPQPRCVFTANDTHTRPVMGSCWPDVVCPPLFHSADFLQRLLLLRLLPFSEKFNEWLLNGRSCHRVKLRRVFLPRSLKTRLLGRDAYFLWICSRSSFHSACCPRCCCCCSSITGVCSF